MFKQWEPLSQWCSITPQITWLSSINVAGYCACSMTLSQNSYWSILWTAAWCDGTQRISQMYTCNDQETWREQTTWKMRVILGWILKKHGVNRIWPGIRSSIGLLQISNEHLSATESKEFLDWLSDLVSHEGLCGWDKQDGLCQPSDLLITCNRPCLPTNVVRLLNSKAYFTYI